MYFPVQISKLSKPQITKLMHGGSVRIQNGNDHEVHLSYEQVKKLNRATNKGQGMNLRMDPYQISMNGQGLLSNVFNKAKSVAKQEAINLLPRAKDFIAREASKKKASAQELISDTLAPYLGQPLSNDLAAKGVDKGYQEFEKQLNNGSAFLEKKLKGGKLNPTLAKIGNAFKNIAKPIVHNAIDTYTAPALMSVLGPEAGVAAPVVTSALHQGASAIGLGIKKRKGGKGGALMVAGTGGKVNKGRGRPKKI